MVRAPGAGGWQRRPQARADSVLFAEPPQPKRRVFLRRKVLFLLRPLNAGRRLFPRKRHADGFGTFDIKSTKKPSCRRLRLVLLPSKGSYTPRQPPRFCLPDGQKAPTVPAVRTARRQAIRKKNLALRPPCTIFGSALYRRRLGKLQTSLHLRPSCTIFVFIL